MAQAWVNQLSEEQSIAVAPLIQALSGLISSYDGERKAGKSETVDSTSGVPRGNPITTGSLETLEQTLSQAIELDDLQAIKTLMSNCLEVIRTEKARPAPEPTAIAAPTALATVDAETGLPGRLLFEKIVTDSIAGGRNVITALFVVERLPLINKRFGRAAGDRVLLYVAQYLAQELPDSNSLSRWSGPAFSAIINADNSDKMESQIRAISNKPLSANIDVGNRSVMLTISCACMMEQVSKNVSSDELFEKMDDFVKARTTT